MRPQKLCEIRKCFNHWGGDRPKCNGHRKIFLKRWITFQNAWLPLYFILWNGSSKPIHWVTSFWWWAKGICYPSFSLRIPMALTKIYFFPRGLNLAQKPLYLVGTVLKTNICPRSEASIEKCAGFQGSTIGPIVPRYCLYCSPLNFLPRACSKIN